MIGLLLLYLGTIVVNVQADQNTVRNFLFPALFFTFFWGGSAFLKAREEGFREAEERARRIALANETEAMRAVAEERQRIARELHDVIAHSVCVMTVQAGAVRRLLLPEQERERQALETVEATGREALTEMRRLVGLLREQGAMPEFAPQPSLRTLDGSSARSGRRACPSSSPSRASRANCRPGVDLSAYRVVQEALTNALKHAGPARAWATVRWRERRARARDRERRPVDGGQRRRRPRARRDARAGRALRRPIETRRRARRRLRRARPASDPRAAGMSVKVLIVDDQALVRAGFRMILDAETDIEVVGEAPMASRPYRQRAQAEPDVVLMDVRMPNVDGIEATRRMLDGRTRARASSS